MVADVNLFKDAVILKKKKKRERERLICCLYTNNDGQKTIYLNISGDCVTSLSMKQLMAKAQVHL